MARPATTILVAALIAFLAAGGDASGYVDWFKKGVTHLQVGEYDRAVDALSLAIETLPDDYEAYNNRGVAYSQQGDLDAARADLDRALEINANYVPAYINRGIVWQKLGDPHGALADYARALEIAPGNAEVYAALAWILSTCPDDRYRDNVTALALAQKGRSINADAIALEVMAAVYAADKRYEEAVRLQTQYITQESADLTESALAEQRERLETYRLQQPFRDDYAVIGQQSDAQTAALMARVRKLTSGVTVVVPTATPPVAASPATRTTAPQSKAPEVLLPVEIADEPAPDVESPTLAAAQTPGLEKTVERQVPPDAKQPSPQPAGDSNRQTPSVGVDSQGMALPPAGKPGSIHQTPPESGTETATKEVGKKSVRIAPLQRVENFKVERADDSPVSPQGKATAPEPPEKKADTNRPPLTEGAAAGKGMIRLAPLQQVATPMATSQW